MATIKSHTDLPQSKTLSKILSLESADMHYSRLGDDSYDFEWSLQASSIPKLYATFVEYVPCWSLSALLDVLPTGKVLLHDKGNRGYKCICNNIDSYYFNNPIDACVDMIEKLHEQNIL